MAVNPRQPKIDALLAAIGIGDEKVIKTRCHGLHLADFPLILTQLCLKPKPGATTVKVDSVGSVEAVIVVDKNDENVAVATTTATTTTNAEREGGPAAATTPAVESTVVVKSPPSYLSVVKSGFGNNQTKQTKKEDGPAAATTPADESTVVVKSKVSKVPHPICLLSSLALATIKQNKPQSHPLEGFVKSSWTLGLVKRKKVANICTL
jgi:hypothetical protein